MARRLDCAPPELSRRSTPGAENPGSQTIMAQYRKPSNVATAAKEVTDPLLPKPERCLLLELPRELRDMVYNLALTKDEGLSKDSIYSPNPSDTNGRFHVAGDATNSDANQVKFACRRLYAETKGLGIRLNVLTFNDDDETLTSFQLMMHFISQECSGSHLKRVEEIVLTDGGNNVFTNDIHQTGSDLNDHGGAINSFSRPLQVYCQTYPSTQVNIYTKA
ncbi:hypothetical protein CC86DRAFT_409823 [Ophiobolus disseminans]|uniref:Uncharacterized protein n=1 Tax=Ophiobolus disseminans TaxID=1469910 RepID=A0A6A6ZPP2_9PLEO|nr:hypothetical protein CC86DRAFT_409823 [Ophiobolus disseminans]